MEQVLLLYKTEATCYNLIDNNQVSGTFIILFILISIILFREEKYDSSENISLIPQLTKKNFICGWTTKPLSPSPRHLGQP